MNTKIRITIMDDHQGIVDGYLYRFTKIPEIEVVTTVSFGNELEPALEKHPTDVLLLDVNVPNSKEDPNPYPIHHIIPKLLEKYPDLVVLVISMHSERMLIRTVMENGASGYILKDDQRAIQELGNIIVSIAKGGIYLSDRARSAYLRNRNAEPEEILTHRQLEALSLCAAYPDKSTAELALAMRVANSTVRNLLSDAYLRLNVHTRVAAIAKARQMGLITPQPPFPSIK